MQECTLVGYCAGIWVSLGNILKHGTKKETKKRRFTRSRSTFPDRTPLHCFSWTRSCGCVCVCAFHRIGSTGIACAPAAVSCGCIIRAYRLDAHWELHRTLQIMERILYIWAIRHPGSGYVQGMNDLVTPFFAVFLQSHVGTFCYGMPQRRRMRPHTYVYCSS